MKLSLILRLHWKNQHIMAPLHQTHEWKLIAKQITADVLYLSIRLWWDLPLEAGLRTVVWNIRIGSQLLILISEQQTVTNENSANFKAFYPSTRIAFCCSTQATIPPPTPCALCFLTRLFEMGVSIRSSISSFYHTSQKQVPHDRCGILPRLCGTNA